MQEEEGRRVFLISCPQCALGIPILEMTLLITGRQMGSSDLLHSCGLGHDAVYYEPLDERRRYGGYVIVNRWYDEF